MNAPNKTVTYEICQYTGDKSWTIRRTVSQDYCHALTKHDAEQLKGRFERDQEDSRK